jgi:hypothetical protein
MVLSCSTTGCSCDDKDDDGGDDDGDDDDDNDNDVAADTFSFCDIRGGCGLPIRFTGIASST